MDQDFYFEESNPKCENLFFTFLDIVIKLKKVTLLKEVRSLLKIRLHLL